MSEKMTQKRVFYRFTQKTRKLKKRQKTLKWVFFRFFGFRVFYYVPEKTSKPAKIKGLEHLK